MKVISFLSSFSEKKTIVFGLNGTLAFISLELIEGYDLKIDKPNMGTTYYVKFRP